MDVAKILAKLTEGNKVHLTREELSQIIKEELSAVLSEKGASASYCKSTPCSEMGFTQKASCKSQGLKDCYDKKKNERKLTDAEYKKKGEIAKAMKRDNPGMSDEDVYPIATATAKRVAEGDPKTGTGKKPKGSGRRLYTDEDPSDTVSVKFSTVQDIKDTLSKASFKSKSHKRQSQIINLIHQRSRAAYKNAKDPKVKARLKKAFEYAEKRKEASKRKTAAMNKKKK